MQPPLTTNTTIDEIIDNFSFLDEWDDRYGYLIELGKSLTPLSDEQMIGLNKVQGCVSQVWLVHEDDGETRGPLLQHSVCTTTYTGSGYCSDRETRCGLAYLELAVVE